MSTGTYSREMKAYAALHSLMEKAEETRTLFDDAGLAIPAPLARLFAEPMATPHQRKNEPKFTISPLDSPPPPEGSTDDWMWIRLEDAMAATLALGILERHAEPVAPKLVVDEVTALRPDMNSGSIYNVGPRFDRQGILERTDEGWKLTHPKGVPVIEAGYVWGTPDVFHKQELAAHRRYIIKHLLEVIGPLQMMQVVHHLSTYDGCKAPVKKDLVKMDIEALQESGEIRRTQGRKYALVEK